MDVVYIVKPENLNEELRYSLRSLDNVPHDNVWIVGYKPTWVKEVRYDSYLPMAGSNKTNHPKWHISWKMLRHACLNEEISDDFILFNDDFFIMKPIESIPTLHRGSIQDIINKRAARVPKKNVLSNRYVKAMYETKKLLLSLDRPTLSYEAHIPIVINKHKMLTAMEIADSMRRGQYINKRSLYGNYWEIGGDYLKDVKVDCSNPNYDTDGIFLSTTENSFKNNLVGSFITSKFPAPSPYENTRRQPNGRGVSVPRSGSRRRT